MSNPPQIDPYEGELPVRNAPNFSERVARFLRWLGGLPAQINDALLFINDNRAKHEAAASSAAQARLDREASETARSLAESAKTVAIEKEAQSSESLRACLAALKTSGAHVFEKKSDVSNVPQGALVQVLRDETTATKGQSFYRNKNGLKLLAHVNDGICPVSPL